MTICTLAFGMLGGYEMLIIAGLLALLIFGKRLPGAARSVGQSIKAFKAGVSEIDPRNMIEEATDTSARSNRQLKDVN